LRPDWWEFSVFGGWRKTFDPFSQAGEEELKSLDGYLQKIGYFSAGAFGMSEMEGVSIWRNFEPPNGLPEFLVCVDLGDNVEYISARDLPSLIELLPKLLLISSTQLLADLTDLLRPVEIVAKADPAYRRYEEYLKRLGQK